MARKSKSKSKRGRGVNGSASATSTAAKTPADDASPANPFQCLHTGCNGADLKTQQSFLRHHAKHHKNDAANCTPTCPGKDIDPATSMAANTSVVYSRCLEIPADEKRKMSVWPTSVKQMSQMSVFVVQPRLSEEKQRRKQAKE